MILNFRSRDFRKRNSVVRKLTAFHAMVLFVFVACADAKANGNPGKPGFYDKEKYNGFSRFIDVTGKVQDEAGEPISNASVQVKGLTGKGTHTDTKGEFKVSDVSAGAVLVVSAVGFLEQEYKVTTAATGITITLKKDTKEMEEVIVTGLQTIKKKNFTGAATSLNASDVERAGLPDISKMLEGQFAGVSVQNVSGTFGAAPKLRIRGATSLSGDNKPLWVIDGIILEDVVNISNEALSTGDMSTLLGSSVAGLNPDDIQDITILRDAAATALYGARAMNGVIVVSTKKGKQTSGQPRISYTGNFSRYIKPNYSEFDVLNSADQMGVLMEMWNKGSFQMPGMISGANGGIFNKMYRDIMDYDPVTNTYTLRNDKPSMNQYLQRYANANTDWFDILFRNSFLQEHSVSVSSGTEKFQTYASTSYLKDDGQALGNSVERFTGNFRSNFKMGKRITGEILTNGSIRNQRAPGTQNVQSEPVYGSYIRGFDINPYNYAMNTSRLITPYNEDGSLEYFTRDFAPFNILNELNSNYMKLQVMELRVQGSLGYQITPKINYNLTGAYRYAKTESQVHILENSNMVQAYKAAYDPTVLGSNEYLYRNPDNTWEYPIVTLPSGGFYNVNMNNLKSYFLRHDLKYMEDFGKHHVQAFAGMEVRNAERQYEFFDGVGYQYGNGGLVNPYHMYFKRAGEEGRPYFGMQPSSDRYIAYMFQGIYTYDDRFTITPTFRYDGSNKMGKTRTARWLPTWSVSGSWNIHSESFFWKNSILNTAILRGSYGLVANIGNATNSAATFYNQIARRPYLNDQETQTFISSLENSELTWEKTNDLNIGLELGFLPGNRILFVTDFYNRSIRDLIGPINTSGIGGQFVKIGNYATMKSNGVEFTLNAKVIDKKDFGWTSRMNLSFNKNKITKLDINPNIWTLVSPNGGTVIGKPQRGLYAVKFTGLNHYFGYPTYVGIGDPKANTTYINLQSDNIANLQYIGPVDPITTGGFYNQIRYKGFTLSGLIKFAYGNYLRLAPKISANYTDMASMTRDALNRWMMPGDETRTTVPGIMDPVYQLQIVDASGAQVSSVYPYNLYNYSDQRIAKGDYIKLSNIALGYNLSQALAKRVGVASASVAVVANNLWIIYADKRLNGQDPEFFASGGVALPAMKQVTLSLKIGF